MKQTIARIVLLLALTAVASGLMADPPEKPPKGMGKYLIVLWEPGSPVPGKNDQRIPRVEEPDFAKLGRVLHSRGNQRLMFLPFAAVKQLRRHQAVGMIQRIWTGESFTDWNEGANEGASQVGDRLRSDAIETDSETLTWQKDYTYDAEGNITQLGTDTFVYDDVSRLKQMKTNGAAVETYVYDGFGNLVEFQKPGNANVTIPVDESTNRLKGHTYDAAGNITSRKDQGAYDYDSLNNLTAYQTFQNSPRRLLYDANDERIATLTDVSLERWMLRDFDGQVLREYRANNEAGMQPLWVWEQDHIRGDGQLIAGETVKWSYWDGESAFEYGGIRHYHLDHLGSVRIVTDAAGRAITENEFYPFGKAKSRQYQEQIPWGLSSPFTNGMRFAGHWRDFMGQPGVEDDQYLDYMHARHYDPNLGRFLSVDPVLDMKQATSNPQAWNRYAYVLNNPTRFTDPTGKYVCSSPSVCGTIEKGLDKMREAVAGLKKNDPRRAELQGILKAFGKRGDSKTAISLVIINPAIPKDANGVPGMNGQIGISLLNIRRHASEKSMDPFVLLGGTLTHEGKHMLQPAVVNPSGARSRLATMFYEHEAYTFAKESYYKGLGLLGLAPDPNMGATASTNDGCRGCVP